MNTSSTNPYEPPTSKDRKPVTQSGSPVIGIVTGVATSAFVVFTLLLLSSGGAAQRFGVAFTGTSILMICFTFSVYRSTRRGVFFGVAAAAVQSASIIAIQVHTDSLNIKDTFTLMDCTSLPIVAITLWAWLHSRGLPRMFDPAL